MTEPIEQLRQAVAEADYVRKHGVNPGPYRLIEAARAVVDSYDQISRFDPRKQIEAARNEGRRTGWDVGVQTACEIFGHPFVGWTNPYKAIEAGEQSAAIMDADRSYEPISEENKDG